MPKVLMGPGPLATTTAAGQMSAADKIKLNGITTGAAVTDVQVNGTSVLSNGVANVPIASPSVPGTIKVQNSNTTEALNNGGTVLINDVLYIVGATAGQMKNGSDAAAIVSASRQHLSVFYGLAKAAGDTTQASSNNAVGTYTSEAKAAIKTMLGINNSQFVVTITATEEQGETVYSADKTFTEIETAITNGTTVVALYDEIWLNLVEVNVNGVVFSAVAGQGSPVLYKVTIFDDNSVVYEWAWLSDIYDVQVNGTSVLSNGVANVNISGKLNAPATPGTSGQVLGLDSNLDPVWINQQGGGGTSQLVVTFTGTPGNWSANKTFAQIKAAVDDGDVVVGKIETTFLPMTGFNYSSSDTSLSFVMFEYSSATTGYDYFYIKPISGGSDQIYIEHSDYQQFLSTDKCAGEYDDLVFPVAKGTLCFHNTQLYVANTSIYSSEEFDYSKWDLTSIAEELYNKYTKPATGIPASDLASGVIPSVPVQDVQVNGTSVVQNGIANISSNIFNAMLAPVETDTTADQAYAIGEMFTYNNKLYKATAAITSGGTITPNTNCTETTLANEILARSAIMPAAGVSF